MARFMMPPSPAHSTGPQEPDGVYIVDDSPSGKDMIPATKSAATETTMSSIGEHIDGYRLFEDSSSEILHASGVTAPGGKRRVAPASPDILMRGV